MFPRKCGGWIHLPNAIGSNHGEPDALLEAIGFRRGRECAKNPHWFHVHPPKNWVYMVLKDQSGFSVLDGYMRERVRLIAATKDSPALLALVPYYRIQVELTLAHKRPLLVGAVIDPDGNAKHRAFRFLDTNNVQLAMLKLANTILTSFTATHPDVANPLAYWD